MKLDGYKIVCEAGLGNFMKKSKGMRSILQNKIAARKVIAKQVSGARGTDKWATLKTALKKADDEIAMLTKKYNTRS